jgi:hypothetical protein
MALNAIILVTRILASCLHLLERFSLWRCADLPPSLKLRRTAVALAEAGQVRLTGRPEGLHYPESKIR